MSAYRLKPVLLLAFAFPSYLDDLKIAESKVLRSRSPSPETSLTAHALVLPTAMSPLGRPYRLGDQWDIAAIRTESAIMRMTGDPRHLLPTQMQVGIFHYEVIRGDNTPGAAYAVRIRQMSLPGFSIVDPRVDALELQARPGNSQTEKMYFFQGNSNPVRVIPEGVHSAITALELYPLDIPETLTAESKVPEEFPSIPPELAKVRVNHEKIDLSRSLWLEQDDFFGRRIQMLWQKGDPWPAYMKTSSGISILLRKEIL